MEIYGEYLFLENFLTGGFLLMLTAKLSGSRVKFWRIAAGSLMGGVFGFLLFVNLNLLLIVALRAIACATMILVSFGRKHFVRKAILLLSLTFLSGGIVMAMLLWRQMPALSGGGAFYMNPLTYSSLMLCGGVAFCGTLFFVKLIKIVRMDRLNRGRAGFEISGEIFFFEALVDSGNSLTEPLTHRPVMLLDRKGSSKLPNEAVFEESDWLKTRVVEIPYKAVGTEKGCLRGFRVSNMIFEGRELGSVIVALYDGDFGEYEMLLNREVLTNENV